MKLSSEIIAGNPVHKYLTITRKLGLSKFPAVLRSHPGLPYYNDNRELLGTFPAMLAKVENIAGELVALHRTYLTPDGKRLSVINPRN